MCFNSNEFDNQNEYSDFEYEKGLEKALEREINGHNSGGIKIEEKLDCIESFFSCFFCFRN
jgi:hypothetical protein